MSNSSLEINGNYLGTDERVEGGKTVHVQRVVLDGPPEASPLSLALGQVEDITAARAFGRNPACGSGAFEDIWPAGGAYNFLQSEVALRVKAGGDAADDAAGVGARTIRIVGLDSSFAAQTEDVVLAGTSASSPTTKAFFRVLRAYVLTSGAYGAANTAAIEIETTGGTTVALIPAGVGDSQMAVYTVEASKTGYLLGGQVSVANADQANVRIWKRENADAIAAPFGPPVLVAEYSGVANRLAIDPKTLADPLPAGTDLWASAQAISSSAIVSVEFNLAVAG